MRDKGSVGLIIDFSDIINLNPLTLSLPQIWERRQEKQQVLAKPAPMKGVERTNMVMIRNPGQEQQSIRFVLRQDPYVMEINHGRNYYNYGMVKEEELNIRTT